MKARERRIGGPVRAVIAVLVVMAGVATLATVRPETFFDVDKESVGSSVSDELGAHSIYGCRRRSAAVYLCTFGEVGSGACCSVKVRVDEERCWQSLPTGRRGRNLGLSGCIGLTDYLFDDVPSFNQ